MGYVATVQQDPAEVEQRVAGQSSLWRDILYEVVASLEADSFGSFPDCIVVIVVDTSDSILILTPSRILPRTFQV